VPTENEAGHIYISSEGFQVAVLDGGRLKVSRDSSSLVIERPFVENFWRAVKLAADVADELPAH
jgi:hypothetical protein